MIVLKPWKAGPKPISTIRSSTRFSRRMRKPVQNWRVQSAPSRFLCFQTDFEWGLYGFISPIGLCFVSHRF
ncbi:hypothetical protein HanPSC8_Chr02g0078751 [Helianthus annuus]|nr:hypothetical protein HanPSC8_Chr02g0078751 [Helianthus annuus]